jgi:thiaminase
VLHNLKQGLHEMGECGELYPWHDRYAYGLYLAQTYFYVSHSTRLLAISAGTMKMSDTPFHRRFLEHAAEEKGHEMMLLNDLAKIGYAISDFEELPETRMFWETQYYKIQHVDPLTVMGYIVALEAIACEQCPKIKKMLEKKYPEGSYTFVKTHGEDDPEHVTKAFALIASLPEHRRKHIEINFQQSVISFQNMVFSMLRKLKEVKSLKVA